MRGFATGVVVPRLRLRLPVEFFREGMAMRFKLLIPVAAILICGSSSQAWAGPVDVSCAPGQHAIVRNTFVGGEPVARVSCVSGVSYRSTAYERRDVRYAVPRRHHRSWGKSALVIGGSAATGAGVGGIVHGKKGALVGAALGGGVGSLYEAAHRR